MRRLAISVLLLLALCSASDTTFGRPGSVQTGDDKRGRPSTTLRLAGRARPPATRPFWLRHRVRAPAPGFRRAAGVAVHAFVVGLRCAGTAPASGNRRPAAPARAEVPAPPAAATSCLIRWPIIHYLVALRPHWIHLGHDQRPPSCFLKHFAPLARPRCCWPS
jgi:hypothetical protein